MGVTIKDVAEAAGVSISTVSKVLNGHYSISEKTAQRVRGIMREMNYYPNANAQSFASGSNHTVVLLTNLAPNAAFQNPHMFEIISGLEEALCKRGYRLILRGADATSACGIAEEIISRRSADAIAVHVGVMSHPLAAVLTRLQFPHIVLGAPDFESQVCWIDNSNTYSGTVAASFLLSRGYKRLAFIGGKSYDLGSALRLQGVKQGLSNAGEKLEDQYIWLGESTRADGFRMAESLLSPEVSGANNRATTSELSGRMESVFNTGQAIGETRFFFDLQDESSNKSAANKYIVFFIFSNIRSAKIGKKAKIYIFLPYLCSLETNYIEKENGRSKTELVTGMDTCCPSQNIGRCHYPGNDWLCIGLCRRKIQLDTGINLLFVCRLNADCRQFYQRLI